MISIFIIRFGKFDFGPVKLVFPLDWMSNESLDNFMKTEYEWKGTWGHKKNMCVYGHPTDPNFC